MEAFDGQFGMKLTSKIRNGVISIHDHGALVTIKGYWSRLRELLKERRLGIRSSGAITLNELGLEHQDRREYAPTQFADFRCMEILMRPRTTNEVFIDYGSGLGRVLVLAAMLPFKRVIGIEISPLLAERARGNIARCRKKLICKDIDILTVDAANFVVPTDATIIYFYNPFVGTILANVLDNIKNSYEQKPRSIKLICNLPSEGAFCDQIRQAEGIELEHNLDLGEGRKCLVFSIREKLKSGAKYNV